MTRPILEADDLVWKAGERPIVAAFSGRFSAGEVHAIVGPNGAGKTTVLRMLAGITAPFAGRVTTEGRPLGSLGPEARARLIALHLEVPDGAFAYTAREVVAMGRYPYRHDPNAASADADAIADALGRLDVAALADRPYPVLSAGEKQRVSLARTFAQRTPVILLDEPLARLDPFHVERVIKALRAAADAGCVVVAIIHELDIAARVADVIHVMRDGSCDVSGPPDAVLTAERIRAVWGVDVDFLEAPGPAGPRRVIAVRGPSHLR